MIINFIDVITHYKIDNYFNKLRRLLSERDGSHYDSSKSFREGS